MPNRLRRRPVPLLRSGHPLEYGAILEELPNQLGAVLWQCCRNVTLWIEAKGSGERELFSPRAFEAALRACQSLSVDPALLRRLVAALQVLQGGPVPEASIRSVCASLRDWAEGAGYLETATCFAQVAAICVGDDDADSAYRAGRLARRLADHARAELWFREAATRARRTADHETYCLAFAGLGKAAADRGDLRLAERYHLQRYRHARLWRRRDRAPTAAHDLMLLALQRGDRESANRWAHAAAKLYRAGHVDLPAFAFDLGYFWLQEGRAHEALRVFRALERCFPALPRKLVLWANLARAAGMAGEPSVVQERSTAILRMAEEAGAQDVAAESLLELARGAASVELWEIAELAAWRALQQAEQRKQGQTIFAAEAVIAAIGADRVALRAAALPAEAESSGLAEKLAGQLATI